MNIITSESFLSQDLAAKQPWVVEGLIKTKSLVICAAIPKTGKSFFTLALSQAVATGTRFLDKFPVPSPRPVLFCNQEDSESMTQDRYKMLARGAAIPTPAPGFMNFTTGSSLRVDDPQSLEDFKNSVSKLPKIPQLFIFDVMTTFHSGSDTDQKQATKIIRAFNSIKNDFDACVVVVAHCRKQAGKGNTQIRGSGVFAGAMEVFFLLDKIGSHINVQAESKFSDIQGFGYEFKAENDGLRLNIVESVAADETAPRIITAHMRAERERRKTENHVGGR